MKRKLLFGISLLVLLLIAVLGGGSLYLLDYSLRPENRGKDLEGSLAYMRTSYPCLSPWLDSLQQCQALRDTFIAAPDGTQLHAYYVRASRPTRKTAVIVHGYTDNAIRMFHIGYLYNQELDYNILLPDLRYTGLSGGEAIQMGWLDRKDVLQWIDMASDLFGDSIQAVVHGISMGAATTMMVSGEETPQYIGCFVADCGYTSVWDQFAKELKEQFGLPSFPLLYTASWLCETIYGWNFKEASAVKQVAECRKPMLFIHGDKDSYVPTWMVYRLYEAKPFPKALWIVPETEHAEAFQNHPQAYLMHVKKFVETYLE